VLLTTPEVQKGVLCTRSYCFIKLPLVTNDIGNILGKKGLLLTEGGEHKVQRKLLAAFHANIKGLVPGVWSKGVEMTEKVAEVVRASRSGARSGGGEVALISNAGYDRLFQLRV